MQYNNAMTKKIHLSLSLFILFSYNHILYIIYSYILRIFLLE